MNIMEDSNVSQSFSSSDEEPTLDLGMMGGGTFMNHLAMSKNAPSAGGGGETVNRLQRMPTYKFLVEPYVRFKFKKMKIDEVKQYRRMHRLVDTIKKRKNQGSAGRDIDSDDDNAPDDQSDLDHDQLQEGVKIKLKQIKVRFL